MNSFAHKWSIENFSSFYDQYVKILPVQNSKNVSNIFSHNNSNNNQQESNKTLNNQRFIYSRNFGSKNDEKCNIYLELCPYGFDENSEHFLSIFINLRSFRDDDLRVKYKVSILHSQNGQSNFFKENEGNLEKSARFGWEQFIWLKSLDDRYLQNDTLTIYCEVDLLNKLSPSNRLNPILKPNVPKLSKSSFDVKDQKIVKLFAHQWTIENVNSLFLNSKSKPLNSQQFPDALNDTKFSLCLYPRGLDEEKDEHLLVYFNVDKNSNSNTKEFAYFRVSLLDSSTMDKLCCRGAPIQISKFNPNNTTWGWHLIKREELLNRTNNKFVLKNRLTIYCEVWLPENRLMTLPPRPNLRPGISQTFARPLERKQNLGFQKTKQHSQSLSQLHQISHQKKPIYRQTPNDHEFDPHKFVNKPESKNQNDPSKPKDKLSKSFEEKDASNIKKALSILSLNANQSNSNEKSKPENKSNVKQKQEPSIKYQYTIHNNINNSLVATGASISSGRDIGISSLTQMPVAGKSKAKTDTKPVNIRANAPATTNVPKTLTNLTAEITWEIPKFPDCKRFGGKEQYSDMFSPPNYPNIEFYLQLCPKGLGVGKDTHVSFRLFLNKCDRKEIRVEATLSVIKTPDVEQKPSSKIMMKENLSHGQYLVWEKFASCKFIMNKTYGFLPDDILTMHCKVKVSDIFISSEDM